MARKKTGCAAAREKGYTRAVPADGKNPRRPPRERADKRVVDAGLADSRTRAQALILAGHSDPSRAPGVRAVVGTLSAGCQRKSADR